MKSLANQGIRLERFVLEIRAGGPTKPLPPVTTQLAGTGGCDFSAAAHCSGDSAGAVTMAAAAGPRQDAHGKLPPGELECSCPCADGRGAAYGPPRGSRSGYAGLPASCSGLCSDSRRLPT